jgi:hypothetical protein
VEFYQYKLTIQSDQKYIEFEELVYSAKYFRYGNEPSPKYSASEKGHETSNQNQQQIHVLISYLYLSVK